MEGASMVSSAMTPAVARTVAEVAITDAVALASGETMTRWRQILGATVGQPYGIYYVLYLLLYSLEGIYNVIHFIMS